jgi:membrane-associated phospholipid phosphatase
VNLKNRWFFFLLTYVYVISLYILTNRLTLGQGHLLPLTPLDIKVPFWPWTGFIYVSVYVFPLSVGVLVDNDKDVMPIVLSFMGMATVCIAAFIFYPTIYPRPPIDGQGWAVALKLVRFLDTPANCLPSQHVALGFLSSFYVQRYRKTFGNIALLVSVLIAISTLTTKQHYVWDVVAGYALARVTFIIARTKLTVRSAIAR